MVIEPDTIYEVWKAEKRLEHAAEQLRKSISYQDELVRALTKKYPGALINVEEVFSFILTNIRQVTEMTIDGFPVVDLPYVNRSRSMTKLSAWCGLGGWAAHI